VASGPLALPTASMTPVPAASGQLTGTQLESVLVPPSDFPAGFATPANATVSSGGSLTTGKASYDLSTMTCESFVQHLGTTGFGETAMVTSSVSDSAATTAGSTAAATGAAYDQLIYQFATPSQATAFVSGIQGLAGRCPSFKVTDNGQSGTFSLSASAGSPVGGHPSVELSETGTVGSNKVSLDLLLSASGLDVFSAGAVGANGGAPTQVPTGSIVYQLMKRQAAAAELQ
jgi:hypothetical protein